METRRLFSKTNLDIDTLDMLWDKIEMGYNNLNNNPIAYLKVSSSQHEGSIILYDQGPVNEENVQGELFCSFSPDIIDLWDRPQGFLFSPDNYTREINPDTELLELYLEPKFINGVFLIIDYNNECSWFLFDNNTFGRGDVVITDINFTNMNELPVMRDKDKPLIGFALDFKLRHSLFDSEEERNKLEESCAEFCPLSSANEDHSGLTDIIYTNPYLIDEITWYNHDFECIRSPLDISFTPYFIENTYIPDMNDSCEQKVVFKPYAYSSGNLFNDMELYFLCLNQKGEPFTITQYRPR